MSVPRRPAAGLPAGLLAALVLAACQDAPLAPEAPAAQTDAAAPRAWFAAPATPDTGEIVPGQYVVVFKRGQADVPALSKRLSDENGGTLRHTYTAAFQGFAAKMSARAAAALAQNPNVAGVYPDRYIHAADVQTGVPAWGIDRVDQAALPLDGTYAFGLTGAGVNVYLIDSGINATHPEFGGRADGVYSAVNDGNGTNDCAGHGTHVAGTAGGATVGLARGARLHAVRVLDCSASGYTSSFAAGLDWVAKNAQRPAVANLSLVAYGIDAYFEQAVANTVAAGVTVVVAAGNQSADACTISPARVASAITVGATTASDAQASFSNYGSCVDLWAPGESIYSSYLGGYAAMSGTSMAAPHVTGAVALLLQANPSATPAQIADRLKATAASGRLSGLGAGSPNLLLQTAGLEAPIATTSTGTAPTTSPTPTPTPTPAPTPAAPVAAFAVTCPASRGTCTFDAGSSTGTITAYAWSYGDGGSATTTTAKTSRSYSKAGTYTATLTVTDVQGRKATTTQSVKIKKV